MSWSGSANLYRPQVTSPLAHNVMNASDRNTYFDDLGSPCDSVVASAASSPSHPPTPSVNTDRDRPRPTISLKRLRKIDGDAQSGADPGEVGEEKQQPSPDIASPRSPEGDKEASHAPRDNQDPWLPQASLPAQSEPSTNPLTSLALTTLAAQTLFQPPPANLDPELFLSNFRSWRTITPTSPWNTPPSDTEDDAGGTQTNEHRDNARLEPSRTSDSLVNNHHDSMKPSRNLKRKADHLEHLHALDATATPEPAPSEFQETEAESGKTKESEIEEDELEEGEIREGDTNDFTGEGADEYEPPPVASPAKRRRIHRNVEASSMMRRRVVENARFAHAYRYFAEGIEEEEAAGAEAEAEPEGRNGDGGAHGRDDASLDG